MKVNEQLLMSLTIELYNLVGPLAKLSTNEVNSNRADLLQLFKSVRAVETQLTGRLISEPATCRCGATSADTPE